MVFYLLASSSSQRIVTIMDIGIPIGGIYAVFWRRKQPTIGSNGKWGEKIEYTISTIKSGSIVRSADLSWQ